MKIYFKKKYVMELDEALVFELSEEFDFVEFYAVGNRGILFV
jgi:hypothetical protein